VIFQRKGNRRMEEMTHLRKKSKEFSSLEGWAVNCAGGIAHPFIA
jgi:hypothetical protein